MIVWSVGSAAKGLYGRVSDSYCEMRDRISNKADDLWVRYVKIPKP